MKSTTKSHLTTGKFPDAMYFKDISEGASDSKLRFWPGWSIFVRQEVGVFIGQSSNSSVNRYEFQWPTFIRLYSKSASLNLISFFFLLNDILIYFNSCRGPLWCTVSYPLLVLQHTSLISKQVQGDLLCCLSDLNSFSLQRLGSLSPPLDDISFYVSFPANRFRFHTHEDFQANRGQGLQ